MICIYCASHYAVEKNGGEAKYQCGDWLKVSSGRQRSPPRKEAAEDEPDSWRPKNLGMDFSQHDDQAENQGIDPNIQQMCTKKKGMEDVDKENSISIEVIDKGDSTPIAVDTEVGISKSKFEMT